MSGAAFGMRHQPRPEEAGSIAILGDGPAPPTLAAIDPEDEDLGDEEDLAVAQPLADEDSNFDDFDDEFDDDFEEDEDDPDWDHPDDELPPEPPAKGGGRAESRPRSPEGSG